MMGVCNLYARNLESSYYTRDHHIMLTMFLPYRNQCWQHCMLFLVSNQRYFNMYRFCASFQQTQYSFTVSEEKIPLVKSPYHEYLCWN